MRTMRVSVSDVGVAVARRSSQIMRKKGEKCQAYMIAIVALHLHQRAPPRRKRSTSRIGERTDSLIVMKDQPSVVRMCRDRSVPAFQPRNSARDSAPKPLGVTLSAQSHIRPAHSAHRLAHSAWYRVLTVRWLGSPDPSAILSACRLVYWLYWLSSGNACASRRRCAANACFWYGTSYPISGNRVTYVGRRAA